MKLSALLFLAAVPAFFCNAQTDESLACTDLAEFDDCEWTDPSGSTSYGSCQAADAAACGPDATECLMCTQGESESDPDAGNNDSASAPGKENDATAACDDLDEGADCSFTSPDGTKKSGTCVDEGSGACGPDADASAVCYVCDTSGTDAPVDGGNDTGSQTTNECTGLSIGDACIVNGNDGVCEETEEDKETGDGNLACTPAMDNSNTGDSSLGGGDDSGTDDISTAIFDACNGYKAGATCSYEDADGTAHSGECVQDGDQLQCDDVEDDSAKDDSAVSEASEALIAACDGEVEGASCTYTTTLVTLEGICAADSSKNIYCSPLLRLRGRQ